MNHDELIEHLDNISKRDPFDAYFQAIDNNLSEEEVRKYQKMCEELNDDLKQIEDDYNDSISEGATLNYDEY
jgi:uncharacterized protein YsxB (DUF464 family)